MMELVDSHAHLDAEQFADDCGAVIERAAAAGVVKILTMGDSIESSARSVALADRHEAVYAAVGIHPEEARPMTAEDDDSLAAWTEMEKVVAIGEIGLDYYWEKDEEKRALQRRIFVRQLDLARQLQLPVCIHDREAHGDMIRLLKTEGRGLRGVLHCYSGSWEMAQELLPYGWYFGIDGPLTYKNASCPTSCAACLPRGSSSRRIRRICRPFPTAASAMSRPMSVTLRRRRRNFAEKILKSLPRERGRTRECFMEFERKFF